MANAIELAKSYVPKLDEVYKLAALTSVLDSDGAELKEGANAGEFIIPKMSMDGLGAYDRNNGYVQGSVTMENETVKANFDRGRKFVVDVADDLETAGLAFGKLSAEFIRTMVVPEVLPPTAARTVPPRRKRPLRTALPLSRQSALHALPWITRKSPAPTAICSSPRHCSRR